MTSSRLLPNGKKNLKSRVIHVTHFLEILKPCLYTFTQRLSRLLITIKRIGATHKLSDSAYYNSKSIPSEPVSAVEKRREHDEFRKHEDRRREEQDEDAGGNLTRQEGAEFAAREARCSVVPSPILATSAGGSQRSSFVDPHFYEDVAPLLMPIESPTRNCATTPTSLKTPSDPAPVTTTSPVPPDGHIQYPELMSQHQLKQGYAPSLQSMFNYPTLKPTNLVRSSLLFLPRSS
ncbi:uncharacterized protein F5891DRAFT_1280612 [Suillus fuscotomentosus]|uniref:Uncharacterized protein n=1 Tax=Suillus fuscotomentosus TaxID=1912939 RepID=A0AAD4DYS2_9AGAM|nr:uncharacterized protein F5891DRAFT_1280612 [Suillus fuscotomentosus]KAG1896601.1 hypothetical protein F5891DRAFT_1280612 [Suillus fuscotomentosus]